MVNWWLWSRGHRNVHLVAAATSRLVFPAYVLFEQVEAGLEMAYQYLKRLTFLGIMSSLLVLYEVDV